MTAGEILRLYQEANFKVVTYPRPIGLSKDEVYSGLKMIVYLPDGREVSWDIEERNYFKRFEAFCKADTKAG